MHRKIITHAIAGTLMGLAIGALAIGPAGCADVVTETVCCEPPAPVPVPPDPDQPTEPFELYGIRLAPLVTTFSDGTKVIERDRFYDIERDEQCSVVHVADGPSRCLPAFVWNSKPGNFADDACSQPVLVTDNCERLPRYARDESAKPWQACQPAKLEALYPLGEPIEGTLYQLDPSGNCLAKSPTPDAANVAMPLGEPIPLDAFVSVVAEGQ